MPDDARERLRRAQHPGDRRQAHPADPQRDEDRPVAAVSDRATDQLDLLFNTAAGRAFLRDAAGVPRRRSTRSPRSGCLSICNVLAAIKTAKYLRLGPDDVIVTVATDGAAMYGERARQRAARDFAGEFDDGRRRRGVRRYLLGAATDNLLELPARDRGRIFNLGYFTWVEQQGVSVEDFTLAATSRSGARCGTHAGLGRDDRRVQRADRRPRGAVSASRPDRLLRVRGGGRPARPVPFRCPNAGADDADHLMARELDRRASRWPAATRRAEPVPPLRDPVPLVPPGRAGRPGPCVDGSRA